MRNALIEEGIIREFTAIPNFTKMGYEIMAVTIAKAKVTLTSDEQEKAKKLVLENPQVIFVASAVGMGRNGVMISLHKNYTEYSDFMNNLTFKSGSYMEKVDSMLISLDSSAIVKPLSLANLVKYEIPKEANTNQRERIRARA
jgi:DNA-binding Lrp family transcriptional regulator